MKHILKKISIAGAGRGGNDPKPPVYKPPVLGELQYGASHSFAETIDLISDGPIEGIVDPDGRVLDGMRLLQGIYFDDTAAAVSNKPTANEQITEVELEAAEELNATLNNNTSAAVTNVKRFFRELGQADKRSDSALISNLQADPAVTPPNFESYSWPDCSIYYRLESKSIAANFDADEDTAFVEKKNKEGFGLRAFIKDEEDNKTFNTFYNEEPLTLSRTNSRFSYTDRFPYDHKSVYWMDETTETDSKLMLSLYSNLELGYFSRGLETRLRDGDEFNSNNPFGIQNARNDFGTELASFGLYFENGIRKVYDFINTDDCLQPIIDFVETNREENGNKLQLALAERALSSFLLEAPDSNFRDGFFATLSESYSDEEKPCLIVAAKVKETGNTALNGINISLGQDENENVILENMITRPFGTANGYSLQIKLEQRGVKIYDVTCPTIQENGDLTGDIDGFLIFKIPLEIQTNQDNLLEILQRLGVSEYDIREGLLARDESIDRVAADYQNKGYTYGVNKDVYNLLKDIESFKYSKTTIPESLINQYNFSDLKFNFSNVLAEFREGSEYQDPLNYFKSIFIDHIYQRELFGPFNADRIATGPTNRDAKKSQINAPQRLSQNTDLLTRSAVLDKSTADNYNLSVDEDGLPIEEGSDDKRQTGNSSDGLKSKNYSDWAKRQLTSWNEDAVPVVHTVYNPNVTRAFISLNISDLSDTLTFPELTPTAALDGEKMEIAAKFPAILNIRVETGSFGINEEGDSGIEQPYRTYTYRIVALIQGTTIIDIGNPDFEIQESRQFVVNLDGQDQKLNAGFKLPPTITNKQTILSDDGETGLEVGTIDEDSTVKRYVKVTKLSFETNSVLINKTVTLDKVTEIIDVPLPYPFSAIVGTKLDSRSFNSIPTRSYDCKLKKVKIPSNYNPILPNGKDKRYYNNQSEFDSIAKKDKLVYDGDWDGSLKDGLHWTDNPAWILYDLLTNSRYGMGTHIDPDNINIWELYNIGRFCDAVDELGFFKGVTDGRGGKEPRFSCNIVFDQGQKIFDAINIIASLFKGRVFFNDTTISFVDDRPRDPVNLFTNETVKDGLFFYSNNRRDEQFNTIEVAYNDRFDNFVPKIEVVEDEDNIKEKGIFKKKIEGIGITSRAMARRVAQHQIFSKIKENQQVAFTAGLESLLCKPGDLVIIDDDLKTNTTNYGKVLDVNLDDETIRVSNTFVSSDMDKVLTVYNPTGEDTALDIQTGFAVKNRTRYSQLEVTGSTPALLAKYTGIYTFSGYTEGYAGATGEIGDPRFEQYAFYTGLPESGTVLYFETGVTGWVFASGTGVGNKSAFDLFSGDFISELTGDHTLAAVGTGKFAVMDMVGDKRSSTLFGFNGFNSDAYIGPTKGALETDLKNLNPDQLQVLNVTSIFSTPAELDAKDLNNYGSLLSGFDKPEILRNINLGSAVRLRVKNADPSIYKVISMQEENINEYLVTATKYDTGKFKLIEDSISIEPAANTFSYETTQVVGGVTFETLTAPELDIVTSGIPNISKNTFSITGKWTEVSNSTGYNVRLNMPNGNFISASTIATGLEFSGLSQVGPFRYSVNALGNKGNHNRSNAYFDSDYDSSGIFVVYDDALVNNVSFVQSLSIL